MANVPKQALAELKWMARTLRGIVALEELLGEAGTLEDLVKQGKADLATTQAEHKAAIEANAAEQATAGQQLADAIKRRDEAVQRSTDAAAEALKATNAAGSAVETLLRDARAQAASVIEDGTNKANQLRADTEASLTGVRRQVAEHQSTLSDLTALIASRQAALDDINGKLADLKSRL